MKVIIAGSRHMKFSDAWLIPKAVEASGFSVTEVVCGLARGADELGRLWAQEHKIPCTKFPADWKKFGKAAGPVRNREMADYADALIVFIWNGSKGSANMLRQMKAFKKPTFAVYDGELAAAVSEEGTLTQPQERN